MHPIATVPATFLGGGNVVVLRSPKGEPRAAGGCQSYWILAILSAQREQKRPSWYLHVQCKGQGKHRARGTV